MLAMHMGCKSQCVHAAHMGMRHPGVKITEQGICPAETETTNDGHSQQPNEQAEARGHGQFHSGALPNRQAAA